jgi:hypothetical protein
MTRQRRAYVPSYAHDLFVSYAWVDDRTDSKDDDDKGWVSSLVEQLRIRVEELLGRIDSVSIWQDDQLAKNVDFDRAITTTLGETAMLLVIFSPGYLASDWCRRERDTFLRWMRDRLESGSRLFLVHRDMIDGSLPEEFGKPNEFKNLIGYQFWVEENRRSRPLERYRKSDEDVYRSKLNELAWDIAIELKRLKEQATEQATQAPTPPSVSISAPAAPPALILSATAGAAATICLAEVTDDLRPHRKKLQRHLDQLGVPCVSIHASTLRDKDPDALQSAMDAILAESKIFVQLLSALPGAPITDSAQSLVAFQHGRAVALGKTVLQWRDPSITGASWNESKIENAEDFEVDLEAHGRLLFGATVQAVNLEDFKRNVVELAQREISLPKDTDPGMIFVNFNGQTRDAEFAGDLCGYLEQKGFGVIKPLDSPDPDARRCDFTNSVRTCSGLIVVYGDEEAKDWTRFQLGEIYKLFCVHRKPLYALALCAGPPANKDPRDPVGYKTPKMTVIDCQAGYDFDKLWPFLKSLQQSNAQERLMSPVASAVAVN